MTENELSTRVSSESGGNYVLKFMEPNQVCMIDEALNSLGEFGEVRLIIERGRLRFLVTQRSFDALKWQPGSAASG